MVQREGERYYSLDFLKIVATVIIICHHFQQLSGAFYPGYINFYNGKFYWGYMVELFFVLSGFFMYPYIEKIRGGMGFAAFIYKRAGRLLPLMGISAVGYEILLPIYQRFFENSWWGGQMPDIWGTLTTMLGIQTMGIFTMPGINNPTWYISILLLCYIVFFFLVIMSKRMEISCIYLFIMTILIGCSATTMQMELPFLNLCCAKGYYTFFTGVLLAIWVNKVGVTNKAVAASVGSIGAFFFFACNHMEYITNGQSYILTFIVYPSLIVIFKTGFVERLFHSKAWEIWGKISYNCFVWHIPVFMLFNIVVKKYNLNISISNISTMLLFVLITECVGILSYCFLEKGIFRLCVKMK